MNKKKTKFKPILAIIPVIIIVAASVLFFYLRRVDDYQKTVAAITYSGVVVSAVPDGTYTGECDVGLIYAKVEVTVKDGVITRIDLLEHRNGRGKPAEGIEQRIIEQQRIDVDAVSGATNSSIVIKKAVDNALSMAN